MRAGKYDVSQIRRKRGQYRCVPLLRERKVVGVLYLENKLVAHGLDEGGLTILKRIALQRRIGDRVRALLRAPARAVEAVPDRCGVLAAAQTAGMQAEVRLPEDQRRYAALQAQLVHANRTETVGQLAAWIAHDVRQPLVGIVASADAGLRWLSADPPNNSAAQRALERVVREGHRAAEVLEKIRALMKKTEPRREVVEMNAVIDETVMLIRPEADHKSIELHADLAESLPTVLVDRIQIQQVLMNLVINAIQAMSGTTMPGPRELSILATVESSQSVRVTVRDSGPGIPAEHWDQVFEPYYTTRPEGLGMGLAICRTIVESFGGRIWMTANAPRGTAFHFTVPSPTGGEPRD